MARRPVPRAARLSSGGAGGGGPAARSVGSVRRVLADQAVDRLAEPDGPDHTRLLASTQNPEWYARQLAVLPVTFQVLGGPELRSTVAELGALLQAAAD